MSTDGGLSWAWLGADGWGPDWFRHRFDPAAGETRFCVAIPYLEADLDRFLTRHRGNGALRREVLCASRHGREVELLRVPRADGAPGPRVVLTARHHACESLANWVLEGIIDAWLSTEDPGVSLHRRAELVAIPFVDKDGVEEGDQGKNRAPHDHNRDYSGAGLYPETRAIRDRLAAWLPQGVLLALDIHCPNLAGQSSERIFFVGAPVASSWAEIARLAGILERTRQGPLAYRVADNLPHGKGWNVAANYRDGASFGRYVTQLPGHPPAGSIEVPYADALGVEVNAANARALGADIARAIRLWLR